MNSTFLDEIWGNLKPWFTSPVPYFRIGARLLVRVLYDVRFEGRENVPNSGPCILICNHVTYVDGLIIHAAITNRRIRFIIDDDIYRVPGVHYFMSLDQAIPIKPTRESVAAALEEVSKTLREGGVVCLFPEGSLTHTGNLTRFRFGIEWMLKNDPVPVVPMVLKGLWGSVFSRKDSFHWHRLIPKTVRRKVVCRIGQPIAAKDASINHLQKVTMQMLNETEL